MNYTVYILKCSDDSLYTGYTNDVKKRLIEHNSGKIGAKYTRSRRPVELVHTEKFKNKSIAMKREAAIKKLTREKKIGLIN